MHRRQRFLHTITPVLSLAGLVALWWLVSWAFDLPSYLLPSPLDVNQELIRDWSLFQSNALTTLKESLIGLLIGIVVALVLALLMVRVKALHAILMPLLVIDQSIPKLAFAPLFVIWFGYGMTSKVLISALIAFFPILITTVRALTAVDSRLLMLLDSLAASTWHEFARIRMPHALPAIFASIRIAVPLSVVGAIVGEFVQADRGLGYLILISVTNINTPAVFGCVVLLACISGIFYAAVSVIEHLVLGKRFTHIGTDRLMRGNRV